MTELTPAQAEAVRRALADARHTGPVPPEVAARLNATLDDLVAEREAPMVAAAFTAPAADAPAPAAHSGRTNVVPLWRRRLPAVLAAAAAVTVFAVAAPQFLGGADDGESASTLAEDARDSAPESDADALSNVPPAPSAAEGVTPFATDQDLRATLDSPVLRLHDATIEQELAFLLHPTAATAHGSGPWANGYSLDQLDRNTMDKATTACGPAQLVEGSTVYAARYHRHPALAVVLPAPADAIEVEIYDCAAADPRVPARTVVLEAGE